MIANIIYTMLAATCIATGSVTEKVTVDTDISNVNLEYIVHGAGKIDSFVATNSREALRNAYADGNRAVEIDFSLTSDGEAVCIHDWNEQALPDTSTKSALTLEEFLKNRVYGKFTPMTLDNVAQFMKLHPDLYVITDVKDDNIAFCSLLQRDYPELSDRFIIQIYFESQYELVKNMGFDNIIFTLYRLDWNTKTNPEYFVEFAKNHTLVGYTFPYELCEIDGFLDKMKTANVPLFVHTVNDENMQKHYFDIGISGVYTDNTLNQPQS